MTRKIINYSNNLIYKIVCSDVTVKDIYIGHTTNFTKIKTMHKTNCNNINSKHHNIYVYKIIRENGGWDNWDIILVEAYPCNNGNEAKKQQRYHIETLQSTLNKQIPTRTVREYCEDNKVQISLKAKEYNEANKDHINEKNREYYNFNKDYINEKHREYNEANKEQLMKKTNCECGGCFTNGNKALHLKTIKHKQFLNITI